MSAPKNFAAGFNHNVKHRGQVFHVQTEDSGEEIAVVSTHLFLGGTILATRRTSYAAARGAPDLREQVRATMEAQHKQMLRDLIGGAFDDKLAGIKAYQPGQLAVDEPPPAVEEEVELDDLLDDILIEEVFLGETPPRASRAAPIDAAAVAAGPVLSAPVLDAPTFEPRAAATGNSAGQGFGDALISDRSLDEVILAYLAGEKDE